MAGISNFYENEILDHLLGTGSYTMPAATYVALFTTYPDFETGSGGTEATGGAYVRKDVNFDAASGGASQNSAQVQWTCGTDLAPGTYTGWAVYDASSGGNMLFGAAFESSKTVASGDTLTFAAGAIDVTLD